MSKNNKQPQTHEIFQVERPHTYLDKYYYLLTKLSIQNQEIATRNVKMFNAVTALNLASVLVSQLTNNETIRNINLGCATVTLVASILNFIKYAKNKKLEKKAIKEYTQKKITEDTLAEEGMTQQEILDMFFDEELDYYDFMKIQKDIDGEAKYEDNEDEYGNY